MTVLEFMKMAQVENEQELRQVSWHPRVLCPFLSVASSLKKKKLRLDPTPSFPNPSPLCESALRAPGHAVFRRSLEHAGIDQNERRNRP